MRTREEHLQWAKDRAMEYWREGDLQNACASMCSDLKDHDELKYHDSILALGIIYVLQQDYDGVRRWIEGFR